MSVWTLGGVKTRVNRAIVQAILERALAQERHLAPPALPQGVYAAREAALANLPEVITGYLEPTLASQALGATLGGASAQTHYERNAEPPETDWTLAITAEREAAATLRP